MNYSEIQTLLRFHVKEKSRRILSTIGLLEFSWEDEKTTFVIILKARKQNQCFPIKHFIYSICFKKMFSLAPSHHKLSTCVVRTQEKHCPWSCEGCPPILWDLSVGFFQLFPASLIGS